MLSILKYIFIFNKNREYIFKKIVVIIHFLKLYTPDNGVSVKVV